MKTKKIIKVLKFIKETCKSYKDEQGCFECPFGTGSGSCTITTEYGYSGLSLPEEWGIEALEEKFENVKRIRRGGKHE